MSADEIMSLAQFYQVLREKIVPILARYYFKPIKGPRLRFQRKTSFGNQDIWLSQSPLLVRLALVVTATTTHDIVERILGLACDRDRKSLKNQYTSFYDVSGEQDKAFAPITTEEIELWLAGFEKRFPAIEKIYQRDAKIDVIEAIVNDPSFDFDRGSVYLSGTEDGKAATALVLAKLVGRKDLAKVVERQRLRLEKFGLAHDNTYPNVNVLVPTEQLVMSMDVVELIKRAKDW